MEDVKKDIRAVSNYKILFMILSICPNKWVYSLICKHWNNVINELGSNTISNEYSYIKTLIVRNDLSILK